MMASNAPLWCSSLNSNQILKLALRVKQSSSTSRRSRRNCCSSVLQRFSRWLLFCQDGSGAGIPVVIKPVPKSEKIVGVGNMTNILEGLGRIIVRGARGAKDSLRPIKILEFWIQLSLRDSTTWWPTFSLPHSSLILIPPSFPQPPETLILKCSTICPLFLLPGSSFIFSSTWILHVKHWILFVKHLRAKSVWEMNAHLWMSSFL